MNDELGFEHLTKRQLVKFCKKFHKDCYRLVGQKMKLKDQLKEAKEILKRICEWANWQGKDCPRFADIVQQAEQFIKETE